MAATMYTVGTGGWWGDATDRFVSISTGGYWLVLLAEPSIYFVWTAPLSVELYVELYLAVHLMGQSDSKDSFYRVATVRSDEGIYAHVHGLPSDTVVYTKGRVIDKKGRVSPFTAIASVTV